MDKNDINDQKLAKILSDDNAPDVDINARKRAVNLAVAEFKTAELEKNKKTSQGFGVLARLMGIGNQTKGIRAMEKKSKSRLYYGGAATAMAVVLISGLSFTQLQQTTERFDNGTVGSAATLQAVSFSVAEEKIAPAYIAAVETQNPADLDRAVAPRQHSAPVAEPQTLADAGDSLDGVQQWRREGTKENTKSSGGALKKDYMAAPGLVAKNEMREQEMSSKAKVKPLRSVTFGAVGGLTTGDVATNTSVLRERVMVDSEMAPMPTPAPDIIAHNNEQNRDKFEDVKLNSFKQVSAEPVSTFSSDVDTASYAFVRKSINSGRLPSPTQVRTEEMVNYFDYNYPVPETRAEPFKPTVTITDSPWTEGRKLMHIGIKGYQVDKQSLRSNLVFLLDVSGSMNQRDKLPLVKSSMNMLLDSLHPDDTVSIVTYAGRTGVVLEPTKVSQKSKIINAMNNLSAGGGTAGAAGIDLAYNMAEQNFDEKAVNRVILATDGDFNVGITDRNKLKQYVEAKREKGIFLSVLGFGMGNYNDHMMQTLAQNGNGTASYIDTLKEAQKVLVQEATSSLFPIAKDVKFQVEFNPEAVAEYRLVGYETRALNREDFNNDKIDAGDIGAGHSVTAIYEFVPVGSAAVSVDPLRYGTKATKKMKPAEPSDEYAFLKIRYKLPMESKSKLITEPVTSANEMHEYSKMTAKHIAQNDAMFGIAVASFAQKLQGSQYTGSMSYDDIITQAQANKGADQFGYRTEFIQMVRMAKSLSR